MRFSEHAVADREDRCAGIQSAGEGSEYSRDRGEASPGTLGENTTLMKHYHLSSLSRLAIGHGVDQSYAVYDDLIGQINARLQSREDWAMGPLSAHCEELQGIPQ